MKKKFVYLSFVLMLFVIFSKDVNAYTYKTDDIPNNSYVIGNHLFTRKDLNDNYDGTLKTEHIMLGAKSIMSDDLDDMIIYYKDPRGDWYDELKEEKIQMVREIDIEYKNTLPYLLKPRLTLNLMGYENGYYNYEIGFFGDYCKYNETGDQLICPNNYTLDSYKFELYEKNDNEISKTPIITDGPLAGARMLQVEAGTKKIFVARAYVLDSNGKKNYSEYSDELVIDRTSESFPKPTVNIYLQRYDDTNHTYEYDLAVGNYTENGGEVGSLDENGNPVYGHIQSLTNYELYEVVDGKNRFIGEYPTAGTCSENVEIGEKKKVVVRSFILDSEGNKVYTAYSDELELDGTLDNKKPEIALTTTGFNNSTSSYKFDLSLKNWKDFAFGSGDIIFVGEGPDGGYYDYVNYDPLITNIELYKKVDGKYKYVATNSWRRAGDFISYEIPVGSKEELAIRAFVLNSNGERKYSQYSETITIDKSDVKLTKPVLNVKNLRLGDEELYGEIYLENAGIYQSDMYPITGAYNISGIELYSSTTDEHMSDTVDINGTKYFKLSSIPENGEGFEYHGMIPNGLAYGDVNLDENGNEIYKPYSQVARVFVTKTDGTRIYSEYSEPIVIMYDKDGKFIVSKFQKPEKPEVDYVVKKVTSVPEPFSSQYDCENNECGDVYIRLDESQYKNSNGYYNISGIEYYFKIQDTSESNEQYNINGNNYNLVERVSFQNSLNFGMPKSTPGVILPATYAVRTFVLGRDGNKIYSDPAFITVNSYEEYSKSVYDDYLKDTLGQLSYTISDVDGDGKQELILRGPFSKQVGSQIAYQIIRYENGYTYLYKNMQRDEQSLVGYDNYLNYRVYQNNDNSLMFVSAVGGSDGGHFFIDQEVDRITFNGDGTLNENRTFKQIPNNSDYVDFSKLEKGDTLLNFYPLNDKSLLNSTVTDQNMRSKFEENLDFVFNSFGYAYTDINGDGTQDLILKTLYGKDLNINYQVHTFEFDEGLDTGYNMYNHFYYTNRDNNIFIPGAYEHYLYQNNDNSLMVVYKQLYYDEECVNLYTINENHELINVGESTHDIIDGNMSVGDKLINFKSYVIEDKGC